MFNISSPEAVLHLFDRAGGRMEVLVHFTEKGGYEVIEWNRAAAQLFDLGPVEPGQEPLTWEKLPTMLADYLSRALHLVSGAPEEAMPEFKHPDHPDRTYFTKVFYEGILNPAGQEEHWYFFCLQDSVNWLDSSQGAVNQKKLETIGELASGVAHDFNNLIMGIQSNAESMLVQDNFPPQARDSLVNIIRACSTGASLTRSLLGYAKRQPLTVTVFNLIDLIHDVARIAGVASGNSRIALGKDFIEAAEPLLVVGSYSSLSHCLLNLIKNAREAMPEGGTIHILWEGNATTAVVTVRDHGTGISEGDMAHIFEPFFSTKKQGTGLGLPMVRGILNQHSGTVEIRSTVGMGTSVSLVWPRGDTASAGRPRSGIEGRRSTQRIFKRSQRIMLQAQRMAPNDHFLIYVIDDDDLVRDGLCSLLEHLGHKTQSFREPEVALEALLAAQPPPEVVIVDYNMPVLNGTQFISRYFSTVVGTERELQTQILLMSGMPPSHFNDFMSEFVQIKLGILEKPFSLETLRRKLATIRDERRNGTTDDLPPVAPGVPQVVPRPNSNQLVKKPIVAGIQPGSSS